MRGHSAFPRGTSGGQKGVFVSRRPKTSPPCGEEFLPRYYLEDNEFIPKSIAVDELPAGSGELARLLGETRGSKVRLYVPQRGDTARLVEMARHQCRGTFGTGERTLCPRTETSGRIGRAAGPERAARIIESYDISNWGDGTSVAGMVVFEDGKPKKAGYRRFKMNTVAGTDDYASMAETLARRAAEYEKGAKGQFGIKPDLLLIDGGRGQVSAVPGRAGGHTACRCSHVRHGEGRQAPHAGPCERRRRERSCWPCTGAYSRL